jgi:hypothetical protein
MRGAVVRSHRHPEGEHPHPERHGADGDQVFAHCREYEEKIESGGIDLQILGIGRTGHIGFNEPGSSRDSLTRRITLDRVTRQDAAATSAARKTCRTSPSPWGSAPSCAQETRPHGLGRKQGRNGRQGRRRSDDGGDLRLLPAGSSGRAFLHRHRRLARADPGQAALAGGPGGLDAARDAARVCWQAKPDPSDRC